MTTVVRVCEATYDANLVAKEGIQVLVSLVRGVITMGSNGVNYAAVGIKSLHTLLKCWGGGFFFWDIKNVTKIPHFKVIFFLSV